jgi:glycosyltransferase involved in cell wall biosynthesis
MLYGKQRRGVLMIGTDMSTQGGISTVVRGYRAAGLFERIDCSYVATHRDGSALAKLMAAVTGVARASLFLIVRRPALAHIHLSSRASFWRKSFVCLLAALTRCPYLLHVHGSEFMQFYDNECGRIARSIVKLTFRRAALLLALSQEWRANLLRIEPQSRIEVLPNAVLLADLQDRRAADSAMEILFLGRLGKRKGTFDLVQAFARVSANVPQAHLICAGDGMIDEVRALAAELGIADKVSLPGWLSASDAHLALARASIFTLPSYAEGLPMALLEAMSWALPVVTSPVGGIPQAVRHGENGLLVKAGDVASLAEALQILLTDSALRERLGHAARKTIESRFSLRAAIDQLLQIYARFGVR